MDSVIGAYPAERESGQRVLLDVDLWLDTRAAAEGRIANTVDYGRLIGELRFLMHACRFALLESAADALCRYMLAPPSSDLERAHVDRVSVRLRKPNAYAALRVTRDANEYRVRQEQSTYGKLDVIYEGPSAGIYRMRIAPGRSIATHEHRSQDEHELVLGSGLLLQGQPVAAGMAIDWPRQFPHRYDNPSDAEQSVLRVVRPRFDPSDELPVAEPEGGLVMPPVFHVYPSEHEAPYV